MNEKKLALITGASSGIGYELARVFAKNGYDLMIVADQDELLEKAKLLLQFGVKVESCQVDLATSAGVDHVYEHLKSLQRPVDVLVLNAGVGVSGNFWEIDLEEQMNMLNLNIVSHVRLTHLVMKDMVARNDGKILMTSSIAADMPGPFYAIYAASKSFIQSFCEAIRFEVKDAKLNLTVTSLQPGPTDTEFFERAGMEDTKAGHMKKDDPALVAQQGYDALMSDKDHVVGGSFMNKIQSTMGKFMTEQMGAKAQAQSTRKE